MFVLTTNCCIECL